MSSYTDYSVDSRRAALRRVREALEARIAERMLEARIAERMMEARHVADLSDATLPLLNRRPANALSANREFRMSPPENERDPDTD